jgi:hypothetical protein
MEKQERYSKRLLFETEGKIITDLSWQSLHANGMTALFFKKERY